LAVEPGPGDACGTGDGAEVHGSPVTAELVEGAVGSNNGCPVPGHGCVEIGTLLLPEHRGRGLGSAVQALLADYLFSTTPVNRLEAFTEVDNVAEQRALERAGFVREGVLRGRGFARGEWRDAVVYGRLRSDPGPGRCL
jgi:RimJ/RimL family protein N-acetyltransferase